MVRLRYAGDSGLLLEVTDSAEAHRVRAALERARLDGRLRGVLETVAGMCTVLALVDPLSCDPAEVERVAADGSAGAAPASGPRTVEIPVVYDGADLDWVADHCGLSVDEVVRRHTAATYVVAFLGFSPGFGYLSGVDPALYVPRRDSPRERVPAGSVAIAGELAAVYPQATPGGWRLIGHTELAVFDPHRERPGLFEPGDRVRFVRADVARTDPARTDTGGQGPVEERGDG